MMLSSFIVVGDLEIVKYGLSEVEASDCVESRGLEGAEGCFSEKFEEFVFGVGGVGGY